MKPAEALRKLTEAAESTPDVYKVADGGYWMDIDFPDTYKAMEFARNFDVNERGSFHIQYLHIPRSLGNRVTLTFTYVGEGQ